MDTQECHGALTPEQVADLLAGSLAGVIEAAVGAVARGRHLDRDALVAEVRSDLALRMLSGGFRDYDPERASFQTYLAAAARNGARDVLRRGHSRLRCLTELTDGSEGDRLEPVSSETPSDALLREERAELIRKALQRLEEEQPQAAAVVRARYLEGRSYPQIALELGVATRAIHLRAHRARMRLGELLRDFATDDPVRVSA